MSEQFWHQPQNRAKVPASCVTARSSKTRSTPPACLTAQWKIPSQHRINESIYYNYWLRAQTLSNSLKRLLRFLTDCLGSLKISFHFLFLSVMSAFPPCSQTTLWHIEFTCHRRNIWFLKLAKLLTGCFNPGLNFGIVLGDSGRVFGRVW
jgi:hypothetical protein